MKKFIAIIFVTALALSGCSMATQPTSTTTTVKDIQSVVTVACGFLPAATTIASIISASPAVLTASQIADIVCKAVTPKASARSGVYHPASVIVGDKVIIINGEFVK